MEILKALGVDWTLFVHLACFAVSYLFFTNLILKPYGAALREREKRTVGNEQTAVRLIEEADRLQAQYEQRAKSLNAQIRSHYDQSKKQATAKYEELVQAARAEANIILKGTQGEIEREVGNARKAVSAEIPAISAAIASKLAGKEISL